MAQLNYLKIGRASELPRGSSERFWYRTLEVIPGLLSWSTLIVLIGLSFVVPFFVAVFIIFFDVYWFLKTVYMSVHLRVGYRKTFEHMNTDWNAKLDALSPSQYKVPVSRWGEIWHLVILPMYNEPFEVVQESMEALLATKYPQEKMIIVLGLEERAGEAAREVGQRIKEAYGVRFSHFVISHHPADIEGEMPGKGSNETWAAREAQRKVIDPLGIPYERIVVSVFDVDTHVMPGYFHCLTYHYLTAEKPLRSSFQPIPLFTNNIWEAPAFARVLSFGSTFWQMTQQARPERLITFSSHSMAFQPLVEIGCWQTNMVSEDSRIFYQLFLHFNGDWTVVPLYYPVTMDANVAPKFWGTIVNQYKQQRRWGYGVENLPYFVFNAVRNKRLSWKHKFFHTLQLVDGFWSWATNSIMMFLLGWLPVFVGPKSFRVTLLSYNLPYLTRDIMTLAMFGLVTSAVLSMWLLPPKPVNYGKFKYVWMFLQWFITPLTAVTLGSIPALEAQTRLMLGHYMGYWVTPKSRTKK
ncbi:MAG: glycosyltransferase family 2 protein [Patescibacteria group bacterium]|nr:glycosyltransferase family 2 protein [Patescibacteria group bacterium]MDE2438388.1 glycosyltransferase family 2 protein [Patescibacteria group bacterium]